MDKKPKTEELRITSPPADVLEYVISRSQKSLRSIPAELIIIIRENIELQKLKNETKL